MAQPKKFVLINTAGDRLQLSETRTTGIATINPKGLGIGITNTVDDYSTAQIIKQRRAKLPDFEIDIVLGLNYANATPRQLYMQLVQFLDKSPYVLEYTTENGVFMKDCSLTDMPMTDIKESQTIQETLKFTQTSLWYQEITFQGQDPAPARTNQEGKITRDNNKLATTDPSHLGRGYILNGNGSEVGSASSKGYIYGSNIPAQGVGGVFDLHNDSIYFGLASASPLEITFNNDVTTPSWEVVQNGIVIASDKYLLTLDSKTQQLVVRSGYGRCAAFIRHKQTGAETSIYQKQDHTLTNFVMAPIGTSQLRFHSEDANEKLATAVSGIRVVMRKEYVAVG